mmetsp:Transcript_77689/g.136944  ORF Transcript_77689/g.136944 Transcript_77689/m.136944 type:complete len:276 (+) Transcript_77689:86-913(+)
MVAAFCKYSACHAFPSHVSGSSLCQLLRLRGALLLLLLVASNGSDKVLPLNALIPRDVMDVHDGLQLPDGQPLQVVGDGHLLLSPRGLFNLIGCRGPLQLVLSLRCWRNELLHDTVQQRLGDQGTAHLRGTIDPPREVGEPQPPRKGLTEVVAIPGEEIIGHGSPLPLHFLEALVQELRGHRTSSKEDSGPHIRSCSPWPDRENARHILVKVGSTTEGPLVAKYLNPRMVYSKADFVELVIVDQVIHIHFDLDGLRPIITSGILVALGCSITHDP